MKPPERGVRTAILTVPEFASSSEVEQFCDELLLTLAHGPKTTTLRFIGPHNSPPDSALIVHDILTTKRNGVTVITEAWSPVLGPSILVLLAGDIRRIRPTTYLYFRSSQDLFHRRQRRLPWEDDPALLSDDEGPEVNLCEQDYKTVLRLMNQYLPVDQLAGKIITPEMLTELGLLGRSRLDDVLEKYLAGNVETAPADFAAEFPAETARTRNVTPHQPS